MDCISTSSKLSSSVYPLPFAQTNNEITKWRQIGRDIIQDIASSQECAPIHLSQRQNDFSVRLWTTHSFESRSKKKEKKKERKDDKGEEKERRKVTRDVTSPVNGAPPPPPPLNWSIVEYYTIGQRHLSLSKSGRLVGRWPRSIVER